MGASTLETLSPINVLMVKQTAVLLALCAVLAAVALHDVQSDTVLPEDSLISRADHEKAALESEFLYCEECIGKALIAADRIFNHCIDGTGICEMPDEAEWEKLQHFVKAEEKAATRLAPEHKKELLKSEEVDLEHTLGNMRQLLKACVEDSSKCNRDEFQQGMQSVKDLAATTNKALSIDYSLNQRAGVMQQVQLSLKESVQGKCSQ